MVRRAVSLAAVAAVGALVLLVWQNSGDKEKRAPAFAGKQETKTPSDTTGSGFSAWMPSWALPARPGSPSAGWSAEDVEEAVRKTFLAYNRQDLPAFKAGWTEKGFQQTYERPKEKVTDFGLLSLLSFRRYTIGTFSNTAVEAQTAATEVGLTYGEVHETHRFSLLRQDDTWKIDQDEKLPNIQKNATVVSAKFQYHNLHMDRTRMPAGDVTFQITNTDTGRHEFILKRIMDSESEETIGKTKPLNPGDHEMLVLTNVTPGRYVVICNMLSPDGASYADGMRTELLVE